jgi:tellurite resistance protein TerC
MGENASMMSHPGILIGFGILVLVMLLLDLGIFNKKSHAISNREAATWSVVWISLAMVFSGVVYLVFRNDAPGLGFEKFTQFQSAYWIEKALSVDNLFVFILVFGFFKVPKELHHKVLFWGIIGALVFRAIFIFTGVELINLTYLAPMELFGMQVRINIVLVLFGIFLIGAGIKSALPQKQDDEKKDFTKNPGAKLIHKFFKVSQDFDGDRFFTVQNGVRMATPLLVVVAVIEFTDLLFAVDSIPAIFAIAPDDPFILYTSNIFAILGLRALYFLLANFIHMFRLLKYGLAVILTFIGIKMVISPFFHISSPLSLSIVGGVLLLSVIASRIFKPKEDLKGLIDDEINY